MNADDALLVFATFPDAEKAREVGRTLVSERLAACVNILTAPVDSIYTWQGKIEAASETLALLKTTRAVYRKLEARLRALHPYEVPEIIALPLAAGLPAYLQWVAANCDAADDAQARG
ncbi:MAG: divalent-cation tolerance protein CutA [Verrucomicrobia bacterium]|nr:divalent-cation tolerance protein CutA [Verrucomicrobiota bacterium]MBV9657636.1 divalent-cation tolerance protein CutA [Verrucomicrobiota bacterium]